MLEKCVLTILELNWNKRLGHKKTKLNICHHTLALSKHLQNRSFHVVEKTRTFSKCQKMTYARAKRAKILFLIVKYANLWGFSCRRRRACLSSLFFHYTVVRCTDLSHKPSSLLSIAFSKKASSVRKLVPRWRNKTEVNKSLQRVNCDVNQFVTSNQE